MEIRVRHAGSYVAVEIVEGGTTIDLGLLSHDERDALASTLVSAVVQMGPVYNEACKAWFDKLASENGMTDA